MAPKPLVSVLIPVYNGAQFLAETLSSVQAQTYRSLEIVLKDDGSTDGSLAIAADAAARDKRVRLVTDKPAGDALANHVALAKMAKGRFVNFLHQDDLLHPEHIATLLEPLWHDPGIVLASSARRTVGADGGEVRVEATLAHTPLHTGNVLMRGRDAIRHVVTGLANQIGEPSCVLFRNNVVKPEAMFDFGGMRHVMLFDVALWFNLLRRGKLYYHGTPLTSFRVHTRQLSRQNTTQYDAVFEWAAVLRGAVELGALAPGPQLARIAEKLLPDVHRWRASALASDDPLLAGYVERYDSLLAELASMGRTESSALGSGGRVA